MKNVKLWLKRAGVSMAVAIKVVASIVLGPTVMLGGYAVIDGVVRPNTESRIAALYETEIVTADLAGVGGPAVTKIRSRILRVPLGVLI